jgi:hypothetical protein
MRTVRSAAAAAMLALLALASPAGAQAAGPQTGGPPSTCPTPGLGPPTACVAPDDASTSTSVAPDAPAGTDPGPALWVGVVFGVSGLAGMAFATTRVRETDPERRQEVGR